MIINDNTTNTRQNNSCIKNGDKTLYNKALLQFYDSKSIPHFNLWYEIIKSAYRCWIYLDRWAHHLKKQYSQFQQESDEYLLNPFDQLKKRDSEDRPDWYLNPELENPLQDLIDYAIERENDQGGDDYERLTFDCQLYGLHYLFRGAALTNLKFYKLYQPKYEYFGHYTVAELGLRRRMCNLYINSLTISFILIRYGFKLKELPTHISHFEPLCKYIHDEEYLVSQWRKVLDEYSIEDVTKQRIKNLLNNTPEDSGGKRKSTKIDLNDRGFVEVLEIIAKLENKTVAKLLKGLVKRAYGHLMPVINRVINDSKNRPVTDRELDFYRPEYDELKANFTVFFDNST